MNTRSRNNQIKDISNRIKYQLNQDFLQLLERKNTLDGELTQYKTDKNYKNKKLFQNIGQNNLKKYFTPLRIEETVSDNRDDQLIQLNLNIQSREDEIKNILKSMDEIQNILDEIDSLNEKSSVLAPFNIEESSVAEISRRMSVNLRKLVDVYQKEYDFLDIILEFDDNDRNLDEGLCRNLLIQIEENLKIGIEKHNVTMFLIQGKVEEDSLDLSISYMCENESEDTVKISYSIIK